MNISHEIHPHCRIHRSGSTLGPLLIEAGFGEDSTDWLLIGRRRPRIEDSRINLLKRLFKAVSGWWARDDHDDGGVTDGQPETANNGLWSRVRN